MQRDDNKYKVFNYGLALALISAFLYAFNVIIEKKYVGYMNSETILFLMYLGSGVGLYLIHVFSKNSYRFKSERITKKDVPKIIMIVLCELFASFFIIEVVKRVNASLVSLLSVFEIVMTSLLASLIFKTVIKKNEVIAIILVIIGSVILNIKVDLFSNIGISSLMVRVACFCWGLENNITASISHKEPALFTSIKCGAVSLLYLVFVLINKSFSLSYPVLIFYGFFTYGLAILAYAISTKYLGASKSTLIFSFSPIFGVFLAFIIYHEPITISFVISLIFMVFGIILIRSKE